MTTQNTLQAGRNMKPVLAWHFVGATLRDGRPVPADGVELVHEGRVEMCASGLHASRRAIDALRYAPGSTVCRVECRGVIEGEDKLVCRSRTILWRVDAGALLREFARDCALDVLHLWATETTPGIDIVVEYLLTGAESLRSAADSAAYSAADSAAYPAAYYAADSAAYSAAYHAADSAADSAAYSAACSAACSAARGAQNERLERMLVNAMEATQ
jgi:hypothetical protein